MRNATLFGLVLIGCSGTSSPGSSSGSGGSSASGSSSFSGNSGFSGATGVSGGASGLSGPVALDQATNAYAQAICAGYGTCCQSKGFAFSSATCIANAKAQKDIDLSALCAPPHVYDAQAAGDCMADVQARFSSCGASATTSTACNRMCMGILAPGASCASSFDCAASSVGTPTCAGTCVIQVRANAGDSCNVSCTQSSDGSTLCNGTGPSSTSLESQCYAGDGLYCAPDLTCRALVAPGGACASANACQVGSYCDSSTAICVANAASGAACPKQIECGNNDYCDSNQICTPKKPDGAACDAAIDECQGYCASTTNQCVGSGGGVIVNAQNCANPASG